MMAECKNQVVIKTKKQGLVRFPPWGGEGWGLSNYVKPLRLYF